MIQSELAARLRAAGIVPVISVSSIEATLSLVDDLVEAGLDLVEIVLRNPLALDALRAVRMRHAEITIAAGTVLDAHRYRDAVEAGADFAIAPGLEPGLAAYGQTAAIPLVPGAQTASEVMVARAAGFTTLKFYPALPANGAEVLVDYANVFPDVVFMPTGKITEASLPAFAALKNVAGVGGSWMFAAGGKTLPREEIARRVALGRQIMIERRL
jgi:2-dehydro-3-deoxyphosphogluconate aldolase/(4S)-4-hydroxy-2-oxoglutarate aldolase